MLWTLIRNPSAANLLNTLYYLVAVVIALSCHEWAHAFAAHKMGDDTARYAGRMTVNPLAHLDILGFLCMMFVGFGWAKPVPVNPNNVKKGKLGQVFVSAAGVLTNFVLAFLSVFVVVYAGFFMEAGWLGDLLFNFFYYFMIINISLMVFNLIPLPPLDGYRVVKELTVGRVRNVNFFWTIERYGAFVLFVLVMLDVLNPVLNWGVNGIFGFLSDIAFAVFGLR